MRRAAAGVAPAERGLLLGDATTLQRVEDNVQADPLPTDPCAACARTGLRWARPLGERLSGPAGSSRDAPHQADRVAQHQPDAVALARGHAAREHLVATKGQAGDRAPPRTGAALDEQVPAWGARPKTSARPRRSGRRSERGGRKALAATFGRPSVSSTPDWVGCRVGGTRELVAHLKPRHGVDTLAPKDIQRILEPVGLSGLRHAVGVGRAAVSRELGGPQALARARQRATGRHRAAHDPNELAEIEPRRRRR